MAILAVVTGLEIVIGVLIYLLPALVAYRRHTFNRAAVAIVDVLLGWTFIGWVVALAMAASGRQEAEPIPTEPRKRSTLPWQRWMNRED